MAASPELPADPGVADFDLLQEDPARWIGAVAALGARYAGAPAVAAGEGTVLVGLLGRELVLKLYPPFLRDHFEFKRAVLGHLHGRLSLPTPYLVDSALQPAAPGQRAVGDVRLRRRAAGPLRVRLAGPAVFPGRG